MTLHNKIPGTIKRARFQRNTCKQYVYILLWPFQCILAYTYKNTDSLFRAIMEAARRMKVARKAASDAFQTKKLSFFGLLRNDWANCAMCRISRKRYTPSMLQGNSPNALRNCHKYCTYIVTQSTQPTVPSAFFHRQVRMASNSISSVLKTTGIYISVFLPER